MAFGTIMGQKPLVNAEDVEGVLSPNNIPNIDMSKLTGVLPLLKGGTGVTSIEALKSLLGIGKQAKYAIKAYFGNSASRNTVLSSIGFSPKFVIYIGCELASSKNSGVNILIADDSSGGAGNFYYSSQNAYSGTVGRRVPYITIDSMGVTLRPQDDGNYRYYEIAMETNFYYLAIAIG